LRLSGDTLYGAAYLAGPLGNGTVFAVGTNGTDFTTLHSLEGVSEGALPLGGLAFSGNTLFGTASIGGAGRSENGFQGSGTVFSLTFLPGLTITPSGTKVVLTWPAVVAGLSYVGFSLQTTTNLNSPVWTTNFSAPELVNGQYTVTNPITGSHQFFRLVR